MTEIKVFILVYALVFAGQMSSDYEPLHPHWTSLYFGIAGVLITIAMKALIKGTK